MPRLYLVRHGKTASPGDPDPGLADLGRAQADAVAALLAPRGPLPILASPSRRTRETAAPLAHLWKVTPANEARIGEIPLPPDSTFRNHSEWIKHASNQSWRAMHPLLRSWHDQVLETIFAINTDTVVVTHFVAINVAVGHSLGDERVTCFQPDNCSCTILDCKGENLRVIELGAEGEIILTK